MTFNQCSVPALHLWTVNVGKGKTMAKTVDQMLTSGDRADWRKYLENCSVEEARIAWIRARALRMEDMATLAFTKMTGAGRSKKPPADNG